MSLSSEDDAEGVVEDILPPPPPDYPPATLELRLRSAVTDKAGSAWETITLEEPTDQQWSDIYGQPADERRRFAIHLVGKVPLAVVAQMKISDIVRAETYIWGFFAAAQTERPW